MFDSPADARLQLTQDFARPQVERIVAALVPTLTFQPLKGEPATPGRTRIGGTPDLPPGLAWPRRAAPADGEAIARRGNADAAEEMRRHFRKELPYAFFAQVDLAEARAAGGPAGDFTSDLPEKGRLLFFYDLVTGPWDNGTASARVFWDEGPRENLTVQAMPADLAAAAQEHRASIAAINRRFKLPAPRPESGTPYGGPGRPMRLQRHPASACRREPGTGSTPYPQDGSGARPQRGEPLPRRLPGTVLAQLRPPLRRRQRRTAQPASRQPAA